ncbi:hypothetical protein TSOC_013388 [Tetrabaena socialis]|uniref:Uncharacterized protein n=1 Tax=Tetrabaena socialis TaxID=47790 RepID=A0A2J7ZKH9_9CHLO|nr:hypothetical protein TSOC_013388 [Tetrabaena socialis]|eukprot:PNH00771.1 hypothetical protein TSOC_013388 [Tetrabaena socialis]
MGHAQRHGAHRQAPYTVRGGIVHGGCLARPARPPPASCSSALRLGRCLLEGSLASNRSLGCSRRAPFAGTHSCSAEPTGHARDGGDDKYGGDGDGGRCCRQRVSRDAFASGGGGPYLSLLATDKPSFAATAAETEAAALAPLPVSGNVSHGCTASSKPSCAACDKVRPPLPLAKQLWHGSSGSCLSPPPLWLPSGGCAAAAASGIRGTIGEYGEGEGLKMGVSEGSIVPAPIAASVSYPQPASTFMMAACTSGAAAPATAPTAAAASATPAASGATSARRLLLFGTAAGTTAAATTATVTTATSPAATSPPSTAPITARACYNSTSAGAAAWLCSDTSPRSAPAGSRKRRAMERIGSSTVRVDPVDPAVGSVEEACCLCAGYACTDDSAAAAACQSLGGVASSGDTGGRQAAGKHKGGGVPDAPTVEDAALLLSVVHAAAAEDVGSAAVVAVGNMRATPVPGPVPAGHILGRIGRPAPVRTGYSVAVAAVSPTVVVAWAPAGSNMAAVAVVSVCATASWAAAPNRVPPADAAAAARGCSNPLGAWGSGMLLEAAARVMLTATLPAPTAPGLLDCTSAADTAAIKASSHPARLRAGCEGTPVDWEGAEAEPTCGSPCGREAEEAGGRQGGVERSRSAQVLEAAGICGGGADPCAGQAEAELAAAWPVGGVEAVLAQVSPLPPPMTAMHHAAVWQHDGLQWAPPSPLEPTVRLPIVLHCCSPRAPRIPHMRALPMLVLQPQPQPMPSPPPTAAPFTPTAAATTGGAIRRTVVPPPRYINMPCSHPYAVPSALRLLPPHIRRLPQPSPMAAAVGSAWAYHYRPPHSHASSVPPYFGLSW